MRARSWRGCGHYTTGQRCGAQASQADHEEIRGSWQHRHRWASGIFRGDERDRCCRSARGRRSAQFRRRERAMQRFRGIKTPQNFSSFHAQVHNQFNQERHLVTRQVSKQRRLPPWLSGALSRRRSPLARWRSRSISTSLVTLTAPPPDFVLAAGAPGAAQPS
jgi:hypothetical protein